MKDAYVELAKAAIRSYVQSGRFPQPPEGLPAALTGERAGVFVSIKKRGALRGCIGTIAPTTESVAHEICRNAVAACAEDPRFPPVEAGELDDLRVSVDVLGAAEPIDSPDALDVKRYGVIVSAGYRRGLLLPDLEGVDDVASQIDIARQKAGIPRGALYRLERFEVIRHE